MHILITGSAGFIASHLVEYILSQGHTVTGIDNYITGSEKNIKDALKNPSFRFIEHDILTFDYSTISEPVDIVFHMASPASPIQYKKHPIETLQANSVGTKQALDFATDKNAVLVYASTSEVYGDPLVHPQVEWYWGNVNPNGVRSCYDEAKRFGEAMCMTYVRTKKTKVRIARIFNTYGPRMDINDGRVVSNFIVQAIKKEPITIYGTGEQTRSFCYVSDLVLGLWALATKELNPGEVINLGNPNEMTIKEIANKVRVATESTSDLVQKAIDLDDPLKRKPDISKAKELLGWEPTVTIEEGLRKTIDYFKSIL
ncbi:MAG: SDR family oxidoreductase [Candidatus Roizmanbacteria bacterium]|nr:SDR family oxidoreductase [Candidatus Roizmanbacteria bacterium]